MTRTRRSTFPSSASSSSFLSSLSSFLSTKKPLTQASLDKPPVLRRNNHGMFMTSLQIEDDDVRIARELRNRRCSCPLVNRPGDSFSASGWPTGPDTPRDPYDPYAQSSTSSSSPASEVPPPIPDKHPLRPRVDYTRYKRASLPPSVPSIYLADSEDEYQGPYTPEATGLISAFSSSSSEGGSSSGDSWLSAEEYVAAVRMFEGEEG